MVSLPLVVSFAFADTGRSLTPRFPARLALFLDFMVTSYGEASIASGVPRRRRLENHNRHRLGAATCPRGMAQLGRECRSLPRFRGDAAGPRGVGHDFNPHGGAWRERPQW